MHELMGRTVRDKITKFEGIVTGHTEYLTGCSRLLLEPVGLKKDGGSRDAEWIDAQRVETIGEDAIEFDNTGREGGGIPAPKH